MITILISLIVGFIAGALVFRNNAAKAEKIVQDSKKVADSAKKLSNNFKKR